MFSTTRLPQELTGANNFKVIQSEMSVNVLILLFKRLHIFLSASDAVPGHLLWLFCIIWKQLMCRTVLRLAIPILHEVVLLVIAFFFFPGDNSHIEVRWDRLLLTCHPNYACWYWKWMLFICVFRFNIFVQSIQSISHNSVFEILENYNIVFMHHILIWEHWHMAAFC